MSQPVPLATRGGGRAAAAIPEILAVTFRQLLGRRRTVLLCLLAAIPILLALLFRAADTTGVDTFVPVYTDLTVTLLLPLVALLVGTAAFGSDIEDGTIMYLLAKPVARWRIVLAKLAAAAVFTALLVAASVVASGLVAFAGDQAATVAIEGFVLAGLVGSLCYCALFLALSLFTRRALIIGLVYVVVWEGILSSLLPGIANLSIRQYSLGAARALYEFKTVLTADSALLFAAVFLVLAMAIAVWRLMRFELSGSAD